MNKYTVIALCGKAGSGKDTILRKAIMQLPQLHEIISCTSRPPREYEVNGKNYYFLLPSAFADKIQMGKMLEYTNFNHWMYGTSVDALDDSKVNIGVFNPAGISALKTNPNIELYVLYIVATDKNRLIRQLTREENPDVTEILRRYDTDEEDFHENPPSEITYSNNTLQDLDSIVAKIQDLVGQISLNNLS